MTHKNNQQEDKENFIGNIVTHITIDELLLFLASLNDTNHIDSRILYSFMKTVIRHSMKSTYDNWLAFLKKTYLDSGASINPILDLRLSPSGEKFAMLTPNQASILIFREKISSNIAIQDLNTMLLEFQWQQRFSHLKAFICATLFLAKINKTLEETNEKEKETTNQKEMCIELALGRLLKQRGTPVQHQVHCTNGIADIVTPDEIYEIKAILTRRNLLHAIGQVLGYKASINPFAQAIIVGENPKNENVDVSLAHSLGIKVIIWSNLQNSLLEENSSHSSMMLHNQNIHQWKEIRQAFFQGETYYCIIDVIDALEISKDPADYWSQMKRRMKTEGFQALGQEILRLEVKTAKEKRLHPFDYAKRKTILRILQSIRHQKVEQFKVWLAAVGEYRLQLAENQKEQQDILLRSAKLSSNLVDQALLSLTNSILEAKSIESIGEEVKSAEISDAIRAVTEQTLDYPVMKAENRLTSS